MKESVHCHFKKNNSGHTDSDCRIFEWIVIEVNHPEEGVDEEKSIVGDFYEERERKL